MSCMVPGPQAILNSAVLEQILRVLNKRLLEKKERRQPTEKKRNQNCAKHAIVGGASTWRIDFGFP